MIEALGNHVVVLVDKAEEVTAGGIHIPGAGKKKLHRGVVEDVGPEVSATVKRDLLSLPRVLFDPFEGHEVEIDGATYKILKGEDILGVLRGE